MFIIIVTMSVNVISLLLLSIEQPWPDVVKVMDQQNRFECRSHPCQSLVVSGRYLGKIAPMLEKKCYFTEVYKQAHPSHRTKEHETLKLSSVSHIHYDV